MESIFTKIINREIPAYIIDETTDYIAFLDVFPLSKGHVLVVPKKQVNYIFEMEDNSFIGLHLFSKRIAIAMQKAVQCERIGTAVIGLEVPHTHIHLVPINNVGDINFSKPKLKLSEEDFLKIQKKIISKLETKAI